MLLTLVETKYLKDSISIISDLVSEAVFSIDENGIELIAMDPANVAMVIFKMLPSIFAEYKVDKKTEISLNLSNLKQVLRRVGGNDVLTIEMSKENRLKMIIKGRGTRTFLLPLIDIEEKEQKVPELTFPVNIELPSEDLNNAIEDADIVGESVSFSAEKDKFLITSEGDLSKVNVELKDGDDIKIKSDENNVIKSKYSIEYLKKMIQGTKIADDGSVRVQFNKDYPLKLEYKTIDKVQLAFILAPRVDND